MGAKVDSQGNEQRGPALSLQETHVSVGALWLECIDARAYLGVCMSRDGEAIKLSVMRDGDRWEKWCNSDRAVDMALDDARDWLARRGRAARGLNR